MISPEEVAALVETERRDVLSVTLDLDPTKPEHHTPHPAYRTWLREALQRVLEAVPRPAREETRKTVRRVMARVEEDPVRGRGVMLFAAPNLWHEAALPDPLPNHVEYGRPDLLPLFWAAGTYRPWVTVLVDRTHVKIELTSLEKTTVLHDETLDLDVSHWRFKAGRPQTATKATGVAASRGVQRDSFTARVEDHVHRFWQKTARTASRLLADRSIDRVIIVGPERAVDAVRESLSEVGRVAVIGTAPLPPHATIGELREYALPIILAHARRRESQLLVELAERAAAATCGVLGRGAALDALMRGEVMTLVAERDLEGFVWECTTCSYTTATSGTVCPVCGAATARMSLRQLLPHLAKRCGAKFVVVGPLAQPPLLEGLGGVLRYVPYPESSEVSGKPVEGSPRMIG